MVHTYERNKQKLTLREQTLELLETSIYISYLNMFT